MNRKFNLSFFLQSYILFIAGAVLGILVLFTFLFYPYVYDFFIGDKIVNEHISNVVGNITGSHETALVIMNWHQENVKYPLAENKKYLFAGSNGFYNVDNKTKLFLRSNSASWVIKKKLARCGESAKYFIEIMNKLGYKARSIHPDPLSWDHVWAEYYDENGNKIIVDPSANKIILDKKAWVEGKNIIRITAKDINKNEEDITIEYLGVE